MLHCPHNRDIFSIVSPKHLGFAQAEMMVIFLLVLYTYVYIHTVYIAYYCLHSMFDFGVGLLIDV